jgi:hypothetical protein
VLREPIFKTGMRGKATFAFKELDEMLRDYVAYTSLHNICGTTAMSVPLHWEPNLAAGLARKPRCSPWPMSLKRRTLGRRGGRPFCFLTLPRQGLAPCGTGQGTAGVEAFGGTGSLSRTGNSARA